ncbi:LysM peptidoglycan-binding domain-containing protein [Tenacibaculum sp. HL-MS23]|uniref:amino acid ABC transporter substrate-binding protein n=1 Tax=Tenacibaculum sp. HL-MS23 TaxID=3077734 RepID=UPI0028FC0B90|nr:LysM peptidoglycan-binding domain-containing protein [Tenacibaculum sp. HL-MS23]WNW01649.1 LysM peptidoglycan-binding domain-containing protein [Tenacibaculum sp. HL-MS23]
MKKFQFLLLICILTFAVSCGQQKRYISYKVQEGETMRDIANRLDMKTKDLLRLNPDVGRKPDANTVIVIPNPEIKTGISSTTTDTDETIVDNDTINENSSDSIEEETPKNTVFQQTIYEYENHTVQAGETVYRITKLYDISKDELIEWNPDFPTIKNNILSIGQVLKVKSVEKVITIDREEVLEKFLTHTVKSKETVYSLTRFYNISKEDLIRLNPEYPGIKNNELSIDQLIKIKPIEEVNPNENFAFYKDSIQKNAMIDVAILLPFKLKEYKTTAAKDIFSSENNSASLANMVTDFYMGAEIAIDSIKKQGILVNTTVFDTGNRDDNVPLILTENKLDSTDVVIGPFYSDKAALIARKVRVPVVFPHFSNSQDTFSAAKLIKSAPDKNNYTTYLASYLKDIYKGEAVFVVGDGKADSNNSLNKIVSSLKKHDSISEIHILKPKDGYIKRELFTDKMAVNKKNWVIITSDDNVAIADVLNSMIGIPDDMTVQVFAVEKNKSYDRIENNKLASINFTYVSNTFEDTSSDNVKAFNKKYYQKNHTVASDYAIKGFDITYDVLMRLASGKALSQTFKEGVSLRLENKFDYRKKTFSSTSNNGLFIIKYNKDLSLTRLK